MTVLGPLLGKRVLITGAATGIGRCMAESLALAGAHVVINYKDESQQETAESFATALRAAGAVAQAIEADITKVSAIRTLFSQCAELMGGIDIVISNAGGDARIQSIADTTEQDFDRAMALNARAQFFVMQEAARHLNRGGRVIILSSSTAAAPYPGAASYAGAKRAAELYALVLAAELGHRDITVNVVAPGPTETLTMRAQTKPARQTQIATLSPLQRVGQPDDIAAVVAFLATDASRWVTRQVLQVGGGVV